MAKQSLLDQLRALDEQKTQLMQGAKNEAMQKVRSAIDELNSLGYNYRLTLGERAGSTRRGTRRVNDGPCPICGFKTNPPHDGRAHRGQRSKKPFTAKELSERGLTKA